MYLSLLALNPVCWLVRQEIARPYGMHRTLLKAFSQGKVHVSRDSEGAIGVLYRVEQCDGGINVLVQSKVAPDWVTLGVMQDNRGHPYLLAPAKCKMTNLQLSEGQELAFRLRANPTKRLGRGAEKNQSKRIGLYTEKEQLDWLMRKAEQGGFEVLRVLVSGDTIFSDRGAIQCRDPDETHDLRLLSVEFNGLLRVQDLESARAAVENGIGSGKAFGFGLLSLAPTSA